MSELMRRDITHIQGVQLEEAIEIMRHCYFTDEQMQLVEHEIRSKEEMENIYRELLEYWKFERCLAEFHAFTKKEMFYYYGDCAVCNSPQPFIVDYQFAENDNGRIVPNWRERLICPNCGCNSRQRFIVHKILGYYKPGMQVLMYEQNSDVFAKVRREIPDVKGFEYLGEESQGGITIDGIDCEDICRLNYRNEQFSLVISCDVFEHTYNYEKAFSEAYRVLKPGGRMVFTVPFDGNSDVTVRRAEKGADGIKYLQEAMYHGSPLMGLEPMLVYEVFGWDILDSLKKQGFSEVCAKVYYGLKNGYLGYLPLYFEAIK